MSGNNVATLPCLEQQRKTNACSVVIIQTPNNKGAAVAWHAVPNKIFHLLEPILHGVSFDVPAELFRHADVRGR